MTLLLALTLAACTQPLPHPIPFTDLPGWSSDRVSQAIPAFRESCTVLARMPADRALGGDGPLARDAGDYAPACAAAAAVPPDDEPAARDFLTRHFTPWAVGEGTLTGYFEPELRGSTEPTPALSTPLLARPPSLVEVDLGSFASDLRGRRTAGLVRDGRLQPFPDRAAISGGALAGQGLELAWVDPVDAFFLHIQGSGRVTFPDGSVRRLGYAAQNGHAYVAIGRFLIESGAVAREAMSMQAIRDWLRAAPPTDAAALMARNPSYVFFRELTGLAPEKGPLGALGAPLMPGRSLAVDRTQTPLGTPVWVAGRGLERLAVAQDTGGAIRGPARADLFTGWGEAAAEAAGPMRDPARLFVLLPPPAP
ncbi:murein transglycosylase A [Roseomonas stagni]|uniref:peptidoglycan lytic exotransglycosylase n=2 Tax=Falsiroseomonas algicola TaxID=2716930 RepID=A0A6M1LTB0_9PROT|nr:murein transglycosylase A [Falsiroseomonas algicola]